MFLQKQIPARANLGRTHGSFLWCDGDGMRGQHLVVQCWSELYKGHHWSLISALMHYGAGMDGIGVWAPAEIPLSTCLCTPSWKCWVEIRHHGQGCLMHPYNYSCVSRISARPLFFRPLPTLAGSAHVSHRPCPCWGPPCALQRADGSEAVGEMPKLLSCVWAAASSGQSRTWCGQTGLKEGLQE